MARGRHLANRLGTVLAKIMPLFALIGMDHTKYDGLLSRFTSGDPAIVTADLSQLEAKMTEEDSRKEAMGMTSTPIPPTSESPTRTPHHAKHRRLLPRPDHQLRLHGPCPNILLTLAFSGKW